MLTEDHWRGQHLHHRLTGLDMPTNKAGHVYKQVWTGVDMPPGLLTNTVSSHHYPTEFVKATADVFSLNQLKFNSIMLINVWHFFLDMNRISACQTQHQQVSSFWFVHQHTSSFAHGKQQLKQKWRDALIRTSGILLSSFTLCYFIFIKKTILNS